MLVKDARNIRTRETLNTKNHGELRHDVTSFIFCSLLTFRSLSSRKRDPRIVPYEPSWTEAVESFQALLPSSKSPYTNFPGVSLEVFLQHRLCDRSEASIGTLIFQKQASHFLHRLCEKRSFQRLRNKSLRETISFHRYRTNSGSLVHEHVH
jgi:hypothetical protein